MKISKVILAAVAAGAQIVWADPTLAAAPQVPGGAATVPVVWRAQDVVDAIGVSTHIGYSNTVYANTTAVITALKYLGVTSIRDSIPDLPVNDPRLAPYNAVLSAGFGMMMVSPASMTPPGGYATIMAAMKDGLDRIVQKYPGKVLSIEGLNEPDLQNDGYIFKYEGLVGAAAVAQFQTELYKMAKADPLLAHIPVWEFSLNSPPYNQKMYEAVYAAAPAVTKAFDVASRGVYGGVWSPEFQIQQAIANPYDIGWASNAYTFGPYQSSTQGRPEGIKETGLTSAPNGIPKLNIPDYTVQAKVLPYTLLDTLKLGSQHTNIYELIDEAADPTNTNGSVHFGLYDSNWNPKPVATVLHNMLGHLKDTGATAKTFTPGALTVTVAQFPMASAGTVASGLTLATQQANGTYQILVWYEPLLWNQQTNVEEPVPSVKPITLGLNVTCGTTSIYDPLTGTTTAGKSKVSSIPVSLPDHVVIVTCTK